jgi:hypothetical protein
MNRRVLAVIVAYVAVTVVMTWPFVNYAEFARASYGGDMRLIIWTLAWDNHALLAGVPLFQSNLFFPAEDSLRYNEHLFGVSLFTLPWAAAGASPVLAHNVTWWLAWPLNGLATFLFIRRFVDDALASFVGSLAFTCSFYVMLHAHGHLHLIWLWPLPLSLFLLERWFDRPAWGRLFAWAGVFLLGALTSWYVAVMMLAVNGVMGLLLLSVPSAERGHPGGWSWRLHGLPLSCAGVAIIAAIYPFGRHYVGMRGGPGEAAANAATLASYLVPPEHTMLGRLRSEWFGYTPGSIWGETTLFAGWVTLALAVAGLLSLRGWRGSRRAWVFPVLAIGGFLISLGPSPSVFGGSSVLAPFAWLAGLPGFEGMRAPARFAAVAMLGVSGLVAMGVASLAPRVAPSRRWLAGLVAPVMLAEWFVVGFPAGKPVPKEVPAIYSVNEVRSAGSLISLPEYWGREDWVLGADYLYYSMSHWRPIFNGFGRTGPAGYDELVLRVRDFPSSIPELQRLGIEYVILHADALPERGAAALDAAERHRDAHLVQRKGSDYLFRISPN